MPGRTSGDGSTGRWPNGVKAPRAACDSRRSARSRCTSWRSRTSSGTRRGPCAASRSSWGWRSIRPSSNRRFNRMPIKANSSFPVKKAGMIAGPLHRDTDQLAQAELKEIDSLAGDLHQQARELIRGAPMTAAARAQLFDDAGAFVDFIEARHDELRFLVSTQDHNVGGRLFERGGRGEMRTLHRALALLEAAGGAGAARERRSSTSAPTSGPRPCPRYAGTGSRAPWPASRSATTSCCCAATPCSTGSTSASASCRSRSPTARRRSTCASTRANSGAHQVRREGRAPRDTDVKTEAVSLDALARRGIVDPAERRHALARRARARGTRPRRARHS